MAVASTRRQQAQALFAPLGPSYDRYARLLSFGQDPRWRRFLVSRVEAGPGAAVLDVATGTGVEPRPTAPTATAKPTIDASIGAAIAGLFVVILCIREY